MATGVRVKGSKALKRQVMTSAFNRLYFELMDLMWFQVTEAIGNLIVEQMLPLSIVESPSFVDFVGTLTQGNPVDIKTPGRKALVNHLEKKHIETKEAIKQDFAKVKHVCSTADHWSKGKKGFLGIQYRSKVWTHFFSFFKTAVEIGPAG